MVWKKKKHKRLRLEETSANIYLFQPRGGVVACLSAEAEAASKKETAMLAI
jgi:hypothetical protein